MPSDREPRSIQAILGLLDIHDVHDVNIVRKESRKFFKENIPNEKERKAMTPDRLQHLADAFIDFIEKQCQSTGHPGRWLRQLDDQRIYNHDDYHDPSYRQYHRDAFGQFASGPGNPSNPFHAQGDRRRPQAHVHKMGHGPTSLPRLGSGNHDVETQGRLAQDTSRAPVQIDTRNQKAGNPVGTIEVTSPQLPSIAQQALTATSSEAPDPSINPTMTKAGPSTAESLPTRPAKRPHARADTGSDNDEAPRKRPTPVAPNRRPTREQSAASATVISIHSDAHDSSPTSPTPSPKHTPPHKALSVLNHEFKPLNLVNFTTKILQNLSAECSEYLRQSVDFSLSEDDRHRADEKGNALKVKVNEYSRLLAEYSGGRDTGENATGHSQDENRAGESKEKALGKGVDGISEGLEQNNREKGKDRTTEG